MTRVGSLCSGYGGLDAGLALHLGGIEHAFFAEYDKHPSLVLAHHYPDVPNYGDVKALPFDAIREGVVPTDSPAVDWLTAGYP